MERNPLDIVVGVGIPTYNRYDILKPNLIAYKQDFDGAPFFIVDNGNQGVLHNNVYVPENNIGVAASWNYLCKEIFKTCEYALILNDDIYLGKTLNIVKQIIAKKPNTFTRATPDWCAFIIPKTVYEEVGEFDECFYPAYYEDKSYEYRMKLKRMPINKTPLLNPYIYRSSSSLEKDPTILEHSKKNRKLYISMWGGEPEREKFTTAFGNNKKG